MELIPGAKFDVSAENETINGDGIARVSGCVVFIPGLLTGEHAQIELSEVSPRFCRARVVSRETSSPDRREPLCANYRSCGGCSIMHMSLEHSHEVKARHLCDCLSRIGGVSGVEIAPLYSDGKLYYRNKVEYHYSDGHFGFREAKSSRLTPCYGCKISNRAFEPVIKAIENIRDDSLRGCVLRVGDNGKLSVVLSVSGTRAGTVSSPLPSSAGALGINGEFVERLRTRPEVESVFLCMLKSSPADMLDGKLRLLCGEEKLPITLSSLSFALSPRSFFQINSAVAERLYSDAVALAGLGADDFAIDAYSGVGAIGMLAAKKTGCTVLGIEVIRDAVEDARKNAELNGIGNISFTIGRCEDVIPSLPLKTLAKTSAIFLDPPRKGCDTSLLDVIATSRVKRIVYVSCNPATLARDVKLLSKKGYTLTHARPYDMFPYTAHVETVVLLTKTERTK